MIPFRPKARILMCRPDHFSVAYTINPWMDPNGWAPNHHLLLSSAHREWGRLHRTLVQAGAEIELVSPAPGLPDLVFTANAAVVLDRKALVARFRHTERQSEEPHFEAAFRKLQHRGVIDAVTTMPKGIRLEGAGDCVWDDTRQMFWMGYGPRSDAAAQTVVAAEFGVEVVALELADARFYHMDTALAPLPGGEVMYVPCAFTADGLGAIRERVARDRRIELAIEDAQALAANAVCIGNTIVMSGCSDKLRETLRKRRYSVTVAPLPSFLRSGGSAFCLTLRLDRRSAGAGNITRTAA
jgi:N-dimethylarginine dimethylaminohydrolase